MVWQQLPISLGGRVMSRTRRLQMADAEGPVRERAGVRGGAMSLEGGQGTEG